VSDATPKTVIEVLSAATAYLSTRHIEEADVISQLLLARLMRCKRLELVLAHQKQLSGPQLESMRRGIKRVAAGEPVQYVLGQTEFMGHIFKTDRRALIPRPETELLVEAALECSALWAKKNPLIVDVGTGSGCIVLSLALARPNAFYAALDVSEDAIALAKENAASLAVADKVAFEQAELADLAEPQTVDAVVSNPPYVSTGDWENLPVHIRGHEPRQALDGGPRGLDVLEAVVQDASIALKPGGHLFLEIGHDQGRAVAGMLRECEFDGVEVRKDIGGHDRIAVAFLAAG
jgi:release factor glutamine methyltransferase